MLCCPSPLNKRKLEKTLATLDEEPPAFDIQGREYGRDLYSRVSQLCEPVDPTSPQSAAQRSALTRLDTRQAALLPLPSIQGEVSVADIWTPDRRDLEVSIQAEKAADTAANAARQDDMLSQEHRLQKRLAKLRLEQHAVSGDGACQFRSVSQGLWGTPVYHLHLRRAAVAHMRADPDSFSGFLGETGEEYLTRMAQPAEWGDELTLRAISDCFGIIVNVITSSPGHWFLRYKPKELKKNAEVWLTYIAPVHYNALRRSNSLRNFARGLSRTFSSSAAAPQPPTALVMTAMSKAASAERDILQLEGAGQGQGRPGPPARGKALEKLSVVQSEDQSTSFGTGTSESLMRDSTQPQSEKSALPTPHQGSQPAGTDVYPPASTPQGIMPLTDPGAGLSSLSPFSSPGVEVDHEHYVQQVDQFLAPVAMANGHTAARESPSKSQGGQIRQSLGEGHVMGNLPAVSSNSVSAHEGTGNLMDLDKPQTISPSDPGAASLMDLDMPQAISPSDPQVNGRVGGDVHGGGNGPQRTSGAERQAEGGRGLPADHEGQKVQDDAPGVQLRSGGDVPSRLASVSLPRVHEKAQQFLVGR